MIELGQILCVQMLNIKLISIIVVTMNCSITLLIKLIVIASSRLWLRHLARYIILRGGPVAAESFPLTMPLSFFDTALCHGYKVFFTLSKPYPLHFYEMLVYPIILIIICAIFDNILSAGLFLKIGTSHRTPS